MHKMIIGLVVILVNIAFAPCINADVEIDKNIFNNDNENFDCLIIGRASHTGFTSLNRRNFLESFVKNHNSGYYGR